MSKRSRDDVPGVAWLGEPEEHDYPAATSYLSLVAGATIVEAAEAAFRSAKVRAGQALSPVLLVRGDVRTGLPAQIADGYHRVCASYLTDENCDIPVRIIDVPGRR